MTNNVVTEVVNNGLCIGCGACASVCPTGNLKIEFNEQGEYTSKQGTKCLDKCDICLKACPFGVHGYSKNENSMAKEIFNTSSLKYNEYTGFYHSLHAGYSNIYNFREKGTSGGIAKFLLNKLLEDNLVDYVIHVTPNNDSEKLFGFSIASSGEELSQTAKSTYYPVEMSEILEFIDKNDGRYAITALPCFVKGLRSAQEIKSSYKDRIKYIFGLTCGQMKTKHFTKFISVLGGLSPDDTIKQVTYRNKMKNMPATNYYYEIQGEKTVRVFWSDVINPLWNNRWFTPLSCNFCDDVYGELADISFMDAWLPEYSKDWRGTNMVISRNTELTELLAESNRKNEITMNEIPVEKVIKSQKPVIDTKRKEIAWRLYDREKVHKTVPIKRVKPVKGKLTDLRYLITSIKDLIQHKSFDFYPELLYNDKFVRKIRQYENAIQQINSLDKVLVRIGIFKKIGEIYGKKQIHPDG